MKKLALIALCCANAYAASISFPKNEGISFSHQNNWTQILGYFQGAYVHYQGNTEDEIPII